MDHFVAHSVQAVLAVQELYNSALRITDRRVVGYVNGFQRLDQSSLNVTRGARFHGSVDETFASAHRMVPILVWGQPVDV